MPAPALLFSGGLDAAAAWWVLNKPRWVHIPCHPWSAALELQAIDRLGKLSQEFAASGEIVDDALVSFQRQRGKEWPRDLVMALVAWGQGYDEVMVGWHLDDFHGNSESGKYAEDMVAATTAAATTGLEHGLLFRAPLRHLTQAQLAWAALDAGAPPEFLLASYSCVRGVVGHCGTCTSCKQRTTALGAVGLLRPHLEVAT